MVWFTLIFLLYTSTLGITIESYEKFCYNGNTISVPFFCWDGFGIKYPTKADMPQHKEIKPIAVLSRLTM